MRWDNLFDDLESQLEQELGAEEVDLLAEEERLRLGRLALRDRLAAIVRSDAAATEPLRLTLRGGGSVAVRATTIGRDWIAGELLIEGVPRGSCVVPLSGVAGILPTAAQLELSLHAEAAAEPATSLSARLGLTFVLRDLCRRRAVLELVTPAERLHGTIDRVGRDHLDLAEHDPSEPRRERAVRRVRLLPLSELLLVRF